MISLVDETFRLRRSISAPSKIVGNAEKSSGRWMNNVTVKIRMARANDTDRPMSSIQAGIGNTIMTITVMRASARRMVGL